MKPAAILALACSAAISAADYKDVDRTLPLPANGFLEIETHKGSLHVTTWDRQDVEIHARIEAEPGTLMDRRRFDGTDVHIDSTADSVHIKRIIRISTGAAPSTMATTPKCAIPSKCQKQRVSPSATIVPRSTLPASQAR